MGEGVGVSQMDVVIWGDGGHNLSVEDWLYTFPNHYTFSFYSVVKNRLELNCLF